VPPFFSRLGEMRDRSLENQRYRAHGLTLVVAAIILWNRVYLSRAIQRLKAHGASADDHLLKRLLPLGWEHITQPRRRLRLAAASPGGTW
jgi:hypothetical protein